MAACSGIIMIRDAPFWSKKISSLDRIASAGLVAVDLLCPLQGDDRDNADLQVGQHRQVYPVVAPAPCDP